MSPRAALLSGVILFLLYAFPGYTSTDSVAQLVEARTGRYSDAHPPIMSAMWRYLDMIVAGPILMLLMQMSLFLGGMYVTLKRITSPKAAAWIASALLVFPPIMTPMAVIWKDSQMAGFLMAGIACVIQEKRRYRVLGLVFFVIACALRHNALAAVMPLVGVLLFWSPKIKLWKRIAILVAGVVFVVAAGFAVTRVLASDRIKLTPVWQDIVGVIAFTEEKTDLELMKILEGTKLVVYVDIQKHARKLYKMGGAWRITDGPDRMFYQDTVMDWRPYNRAWRTLVFGDPGAYFAYHWDNFSILLGTCYDCVAAAVWNLPLEKADYMQYIEHNAAWSRFQDFVAWPLYDIAVITPLFTPWVYAAIGLLLLALCVRDRLTFGLLTSGLLYQLSYFPVGANPDYRYSHWMIACVCLATVILFIQRLRTAPK
jgi:hypothetical protein